MTTMSTMSPQPFRLERAHPAGMAPAAAPGLMDATALSPSCAFRALLALCARRLGAQEGRSPEALGDPAGFEPADCLGRIGAIADREEVAGEIVFVDRELGIARLAELGSGERPAADSWWLSVCRAGGVDDALWDGVRVGACVAARHLGRGQGELIAVLSSGRATRSAIDFERETIAGAVDGMCFAGEADDDR